MLVAGVTVAGLAAATGAALEPEWKAVVKPNAGSGITGEAGVEGTDREKKAKADISIKGATPGAELPWHIHGGKCGDSGPVIGQGSAYPVLKVKEDGTAKAEAKLDIQPPTSGMYYVNVHKSAADMKTIVACGDFVMDQGKDNGKTAGY